jgi:hypothetical protein
MVDPPFKAARTKLHACKEVVAIQQAEETAARLRAAIASRDAQQLDHAMSDASAWVTEFAAFSSATLKSALILAKRTVAELEAEELASTFAAEIRDMDDALLNAHAARFQSLEAEVARLRPVVEETQRANEEQLRTQAYRASSLPDEIRRALNKQIVYTNSGLKFKAKAISYTCGGVSQNVFMEAFGASSGSKTVTKSAGDLGISSKGLRYGASLECSHVTIRLSGDTLTAKSSYSLVKY